MALPGDSGVLPALCWDIRDTVPSICGNSLGSPRLQCVLAQCLLHKPGWGSCCHTAKQTWFSANLSEYTEFVPAGPVG